jgi:hypothetical protein
VIRFTAPDAGTFVLATSFTGIDFAGPTTTDVHVLLNGSSIFDGNVDGFGPGSGPSFTTTLTLHAGDTVDFAVDDVPPVVGSGGGPAGIRGYPATAC